MFSSEKNAVLQKSQELNLLNQIVMHASKGWLIVGQIRMEGIKRIETFIYAKLRFVGCRLI